MKNSEEPPNPAPTPSHIKHALDRNSGETMEGQQHIEADALLDAKQVKALLRCSLPFVYKLAERGQIACIRIPCQTLGTRKKELVRFKREDVTGFIEAHYRKV